MSTRRLHVTIALAVTSAAVLALTTAAPAVADSPIYHVAFTGIGIYPRAAADMAADRIGPALPDGAGVAISCEAVGTPVTNELNHVSPVWAQLMDGRWLPVIYLDTPGLGKTPGVPDCDASSVASAPETPYPESGLRVVSDSSDPDQLQVANQLLNHYYDKSGSQVVIDWNFFERDQALMRWARTLPADSYGRQYSSSAEVDGQDFFLALGSISFARTSQHCFAMHDKYDFNPFQYPTLWLDATSGAAKPFQVRASGCES